MKYVILAKDNVTGEMISECVQTSLETLRVSKDGNTILKYEGTQPDSLNGYKDYTKDELKTELAKAEWQGEPY